MILYYLRRLAASKAGKCLALAIAIVRHANLLFPLVFAHPASRIGRYLRFRPEILEFVYGRFIAANWDASTKVRTAISHVNTVAKIGGILDFQSDEVEELIRVASAGPDYWISLDQPRWLLREGQLAFSLWEGIDRIFSVSFSLRTEGCDRIAFIGGIQGRRQVTGEEDILERYRRFTKAANGSRPRDFTIEAFKIFCKVFGITHIFAVAQNNHPLQGKSEGFKLNYDDVWLERGGKDAGSGFYTLPTGLQLKPREEIPAKKRTQYLRRAEMFAELEQRMIEQAAKFKPKTPGLNLIEQHAQEEPSILDELLRVTAYTCAIFVLLVTNIFGGTLVGFTIGMAIVHLTYWFLKGNIPEQAARRISTVRRIRESPIVVRAGSAAFLFAATIALDFLLSSDVPLGRVFKLYFLSVFFSSLCFGTRVTAATAGAFVFALNFLHLPPLYTLAVSNWHEVLNMLVFVAMAGVVFIVPRLLLVSIELKLKEAAPRKTWRV